MESKFSQAGIDGGATGGESYLETHEQRDYHQVCPG